MYIISSCGSKASKGKMEDIEMARKKMTLGEVLAEVERLEKSEYVKIWKQSDEQKLRRKMYNLRYLESMGKKVAKEHKNSMSE